MMQKRLLGHDWPSASILRVIRLGLVLTIMLILTGRLIEPPTAHAATLPSGFQESIVESQIAYPTDVQFALDGRIFVAQKSGTILVYDNLSDKNADLFADLRTNVYNFHDRGLLSLALDPAFPSKPYVYVLYTYDAEIGGVAPRWGTVGGTYDTCPTPPGETTDGCVVSARLSRLQAAGNFMTGSEKVLIEDWCQQYPSHSIGSLVFGPDGALYASAGEGASYTFTDFGQDGNPLNPCGDPPTGVGGTQTPPTAEGGALRSLDVRTTGDPTGLSGTIIRIDPATGAALPDNPLAGSSDPNTRRIIAYGLRNPFRMTTRPGTNEIWLGDVGWNKWEEINRIGNARDSVIENFSWPCYEGTGRQPGYDSANLNMCEQLYAETNAVTPPIYAYDHSQQVVAGETCPTGSSSISGLAFYNGGAYPNAYDGALFFADYSRDCIWVMYTRNGVPDPATRETFMSGAANPVSLKIGPGGDLFYVDHTSGTIRRIQYANANQPPTAVISAVPTSGPAPLTVNFDGTASSDPDAGDAIMSYTWDLNGDGVYDDSLSPTPSYTYNQPGNYTVQLKVTDKHGAVSSPASQLISVNNTPPAATIDSPLATTKWKVGDVISFSGHASDAEDGTLPALRLSWSLILHHCPSTCHTHTLENYTGVASGTFTAPDHDYPSHLELQLTATDSGGLQNSTSVLLYPQTVDLFFASNPTGLSLTVGSTSRTTPFNQTVIVGSSNSVSASSPQTLGGTTYTFSSWSDGGAQSHTISAAATATTYTATYAGPLKLVGDQNVETSQDNSRAGVATAFQYTASASGTASKLTIYMDSSNRASSVIVGLYADNNNNPGTLLAQATIANPSPGAWNSVTLSPTSTTNGTKYWIAVLSPSGSRNVYFRDVASGGNSQTSAQTKLTSLPATWQTGRASKNSPMSAYVLGSP